MAHGLPQIPSQDDPFIYQDGNGVWRLEVDWYLYFYSLSLPGSGSGSSGAPTDCDVEALGADIANLRRDIDNAQTLAFDAFITALGATTAAAVTPVGANDILDELGLAITDENGFHITDT